MLVLSRKKNESLVINDDVTIVVVEIRGDKVRLGIEAPTAIPVHRQEIYDKLRSNNNGGDPANEVDASLATELRRDAEGTDATPSKLPPSGETTWEN